MSTEHNRRQFLERLGIGTAGVITAGYSATAAGFAANETISVGCIGTGGRCRQLMSVLKDLPGVKMTAVCDVWDNSIEAAQRIAEPGAFVTKDYRAVLDRDDIDAVLIGTPDHWHVPLMIAACAAGKDVYVEKPFTHDLAEGERAIRAPHEHQRIVQVGMQQRSMPQFQQGYEIVKRGELGTVHKVHLTWNRNSPRVRSRSVDVDPATVDWKQFLGSAPEQPFDPYRFRHWRWFWDFGGGILTDLMVHFIDVANWYLDVDYPETATTIGDHFMAAGIWETPDTIQTLLRYPEREVQIYFEGTFVNARNAAMLEFMGTDATLYLDRGRYELHPERNRKIEYRELVLGSGSRGADFYDQPPGEKLHLANWLECVRSRQQPNAPVEAGVKAVLGAHLGNQAYRTGAVVTHEA